MFIDCFFFPDTQFILSWLRGSAKQTTMEYALTSAMESNLHSVTVGYAEPTWPRCCQFRKKKRIKRKILFRFKFLHFKIHNILCEWIFNGKMHSTYISRAQRYPLTVDTSKHKTDTSHLWLEI